MVAPTEITPMQLQYVDYKFKLLTPCFSGTALGRLDNHAEMRIPPIRGHIRFWHRALFDCHDCNRVWGSASGQSGHGSLVALRFVGTLSNMKADPDPAILPHKNDSKQRGRRPALACGESFDLRLHRLVGCTDQDWDHAQRALKLWLLLGGLGLRSNRAAGSVWPDADWAPKNTDDLKRILKQLDLKNCEVAIIGMNVGKTPDELRITASDTISGNPHRNIFGGIQPRQPSPVKFKVIKFDNCHCLLACAPCNNGQNSILREAQRLLKEKPAPQRWLALGKWDYIFA